MQAYVEHARPRTLYILIEKVELWSVYHFRPYAWFSSYKYNEKIKNSFLKLNRYLPAMSSFWRFADSKRFF